ncbi:putative Ig domain-containing protein [Cellulomonas gilvus]|uniref:LPXTG-motif cell wall anchor domain protein n=1 Tax=Cellulomonas gilvus (strain ATCC 13127 / NRRL B-14078) TaxID=593907 RepID=F7ZZL8_CELGA|nr:putative Ig domain-containing protein [Cellulomonas gilvus]AEI11364.1 LPXTG-motif cell wall anchor domain protein [Cellulomonas gilvus ATCC 13127]
MRISLPVRRLAAALATTALTLTTVVAGLAAPASAAEVGFSVDDFAGSSMGTRELVPGNYSCSPSDGNTLTMGSGTMKVDVRVPDPIGCTYGSAQIRWTSPTSVNLEQGGADRILLRYRDVLPNQPSAVTFGLEAVDVNGRVASVGGLTRNGGAAADWLTIRYQPEYVGDVAYLHFPAGFDRAHVRTVTLLVAATAAHQDVSVTFEGVGSNVGEPAYQAPVIGGPDAYAFPASTTSTRTFTVTGNPAPDVTVTSGKPAWLGVSTAKSGSTTTVTLTGDPGATYADVTMRVHADVANSLTADRDVRVVVPSPVTVGYAADPVRTRVGQAGPLVLGTASAVPGARVLGPTTGLPPGTSLTMSGTDLRLSGTPTTGGLYTVSSTVGHDWSTAPFTTTVEVGAEPSLSTVDDLVLVRGEPITPFTLTATGYPAPTTASVTLPAGLSIDGDLRVTGTPTEAGTTTASVAVTNAYGTATETFAVTVGERPAVLAPGTAWLVAGDHTTLPLTTSGTAPVVTATGLPDGMTVVQTGGVWTVTGTPARPSSLAAASGHAQLVATNAFGASAPTTWAWHVEAAPLATGPASVATTVGTALPATSVTVTGYPTPVLDVTAPDGGPVTLPAGLSLDLGTPGVVRVVGTPTEPGTARVRIVATNGVGTGVDRTLTVAALQGPAFGDPSPTLAVRAGTQEDLALTWTGHETPTLTLDSTLPAWLSFDATSGTFHAAPPAGLSGSFGPYAVTATNATGSATAQVRVDVTTPAALSAFITTVAVQPGVWLGGLDVAFLGGFPAPELTATGLPAGLTVTAAGGVVRLAGTTNAPGGAYDATITADNGVGAASTASLRVVVRTPAVLTAPSTVTVPVGVPTTLPVTLGGYPEPALSTGTLPPGLALSGGTVTGTPTVPGAYDVTLSASNGVGTDPAPVQVTVVVTAAPAFASEPSTTTARLGDALDVAAFAVAGHPVPDASATGLPPGLGLEQTGTSVRLTGTPTRSGVFDAELTLTSTVGTAERTWRIVVHEPAQVDAPATATADVDTAMAPVPLEVAGYPVPSLEATGLPDGVALVQDVDGARLTGTPTRDGRFTVAVVADNGVGAPATATVELDVRSVPTLGADVVATFPAGETSTVTLQPRGYPAPVLTTSSLPAWLTFDAASATLTGSPTAAAQGPVPDVVVTATNPRGEASTTVRITVTAGPGATTTDGTTTVRSGRAVDVVLTQVTGHPRPTVTADGLPAGLEVAVRGDDLRLTGRTTAAGTHTVRLAIHNGAGPDLAVPWTVVVEAPARVATAGTVRVDLGEPVDVPVVADGYPAPTVSAVGLPAGVTWLPGPGGGRLVGTPVASGTSHVVLTAHNGIGQDAVATTTLVVREPAVVDLPVTVSASTVRVGGTVTVRAAGLQAGERAEVWLHSDPVLLSRATADEDGAVVVSARIPQGTPAGVHTLVVESASGATGRVTLRVAASPDPTPTTAPSDDPSDDPSQAPSDDDLATTGSDVVPLALVGAVALVAGAVLLLIRRRTS